MRHVIEVTSKAGTTIAVTVGRAAWWDFATPASHARWMLLDSTEQHELRMMIAAARDRPDTDSDTGGPRA
jgi:hypothetical protein